MEASYRQTGSFRTSAYATLSDANGFEIGWTVGDGGWQAFDPSTYPAEIGSPGSPLPSTLFIHPGPNPVKDPATIQYSGQSVPCTLNGNPGSSGWTCSAQFKCPQKTKNPNGFTPGTCGITMTQTNQTATLTKPDETVQPSTPDNRYDVSVGVTDGARASADSALGIITGDKNPLTLKGTLPKSLTITPEIQGNYVQFKYDTLVWTSNDKGNLGCHTNELRTHFYGNPLISEANWDHFNNTLFS